MDERLFKLQLLQFQVEVDKFACLHLSSLHFSWRRRFCTCHFSQGHQYKASCCVHSALDSASNLLSCRVRGLRSYSTLCKSALVCTADRCTRLQRNEYSSIYSSTRGYLQPCCGACTKVAITPGISTSSRPSAVDIPKITMIDRFRH
jgi:hypothetical protein